MGLPRSRSGGGAPEGARVLRQHVAQGHVAAVLGLVADGIFLAEVLGLNDDISHSSFGTRIRRIPRIF